MRGAPVVVVVAYGGVSQPSCDDGGVGAAGTGGCCINSASRIARRCALASALGWRNDKMDEDGEDDDATDDSGAWRA